MIAQRANYFTTLGARLLRGRYFNENDSASGPAVAIVNRAFAKRRQRNLWVTDIQSEPEGPARAAGEPNVR
jgi:hypothetical protein